MLKTFIALILTISVLSASVPVEDKILDNFMDKPLSELYETWRFVYKKHLLGNSAEDIKRFENFINNVNSIKAHNAKNPKMQMGLNEFSDLSWEEFQKKFNLDKFISTQEVKNFLEPTELERQETKLTPNLKYSAVDHRQYARPIRNQKSCGSCWSFATLGVMEINYNIKNKENQLQDYLSTQYSVDCDHGNSGCHGGWYTNSFKFYRNKGAVWEKSYPYTAKEGECQPPSDKDRSPAIISKYNTSNWPDALHQLLDEGAVAIAVGVDSKWMSYKSGVYDLPCIEKINHAVILVGYGFDENNEGYWIVRNSWGTTWGESGYIRIKDDYYNQNSCNVGNYGFQPVMA